MDPPGCLSAACRACFCLISNKEPSIYFLRACGVALKSTECALSFLVAFLCVLLGVQPSCVPIWPVLWTRMAVTFIGALLISDISVNTVLLGVSFEPGIAGGWQVLTFEGLIFGCSLPRGL